MNGFLAVVAWLAVLNPPRTRLGLPERDGRGRVEVVGAGVTLGVAVLLGLSASSGRLLATLDISPEMFRIAAGFVLVIVAGWMLFVPIPPDEPVAKGLMGALWPVAYPRILSPEALTLAITMGASDGVPAGPAILAGAVVVLAAVIPLGRTGRRVTAALGRLTAVGLVVVAVWLAIQGVREV